MNNATLKKRLFGAVVLALVLAAFAAPATAWAAEVSHNDGQFAGALFLSTDPSGCIVTQVLVSAADSQSQSPPAPAVSQSRASIAIIQFDRCTGTLLVRAGALPLSLADADFQVGGQLDTATLHASLMLFDSVSGSSFPVEVNLTWTGTGDLVRTHGTSTPQGPGVTLISQFKDLSRPAQASGSVRSGTTHFTPEPSRAASLRSTSSTTVTVD